MKKVIKNNTGPSITLCLTIQLRSNGRQALGRFGFKLDSLPSVSFRAASTGEFSRTRSYPYTFDQMNAHKHIWRVSGDEFSLQTEPRNGYELERERYRIGGVKVAEFRVGHDFNFRANDDFAHHVSRC